MRLHEGTNFKHFELRSKHFAPLAVKITNRPPVNKFKPVSLLFASLLLLVPSVFSQPNYSKESSFQNKNPDQSIAAVLIDVDDALDTDYYSVCHDLHFTPLTLLHARQSLQFVQPLASPHLSPLPFYLKIRNLRI